ncbi:MAG: hypothetical protein H0W78_14185 [Planctomycetes bacterium]|jgi:hypothetical protein|nr:hypothetical protein [Planctomycetota bacterium]
MRLIPLALIALIITGCTSSGGGDSSTPPSGEIGRRAVPGYEVIVSREATAPAGVYRVDLVGAPPQQVDAWVACCGYDPDAATIPAEAIAGTTNAWRVTLPTGGKLWVRITDAGGNLLEVGGDDFPVGP